MGKIKHRWSDFGPLPNYERCLRFEIEGKVGVIIIHNTTLGPALGGFRVIRYRSEAEMVADVARLARGMSYKNAASGFELGGGKAAVNVDPREITSKFLEMYGEIIDSLKGRYITAPDFGTTVEMMDVISETTQFVDCLSEQKGGLGDPSPSTARGVFLSILAALPFAFGENSKPDKKVLLQGYGKVGQPLASMLREIGFEVLVVETKNRRILQAQENGFQLIAPEQFLSTPADIFSPCATGGIINSENIPFLKQTGIRLICGAANNQLRNEEKDSQLLKESQIWYVPDFIANAGGVAIAYTEWEMRQGKIKQGQTKEETENRLKKIARRVKKFLRMASGRNLTTLEAARKLAEDAVADAGGALH